MRWTLVLAALVVIGSGCQRFRQTGATWGMEAFYVTADIDSFTAGLSGDTPVNMVGDGHVTNQANIWGGEISYTAGADIYGGGYSYFNLGGTSTISGGDIDFGGHTFTDGTDVSTYSEFHLYKIFVANKTSTKGGAMNQFAFILEFLDFNMSMREVAVPTNVGRFSHRSPMLLLGYQWETVAGGGGTSYYAKVEWMDLDVIRLGHTGGNFTDVTAGVKWALGGASAKSQLLIGYRYFEAHLNISGDTMTLGYDGPIVGFTASF